MFTNQKTKILMEIWECGTMDVDYILALMDDFEVTEEDIDVKANGNEVIAQIFEKALAKMGISVNHPRVNYYTNMMDSHLYIDNNKIVNKSEIENIQPDFSQGGF